MFVTGLVDWLVVFYVPSTARSFRDGTPIYCPYEGREARFLHRSHRESNYGPLHGATGGEEGEIHIFKKCIGTNIMK